MFSKARLNAPFLAFLINFCPLKMETQLAALAMLNETFSVSFEHCKLCTLRSFQSKINRLCVPWYFEAPCGNAFCQHGKTSVGNIFTNSFFSVQRTHLPGFMSSMTKSPQSCACIKEKYMHFTPNHKFIFLHASQCFKNDQSSQVCSKFKLRSTKKI